MSRAIKPETSLTEEEIRGVSPDSRAVSPESRAIAPASLTDEDSRAVSPESRAIAPASLTDEDSRAVSPESRAIAPATLVQNVADSDMTTGEPIVDIDEAAAERVRKNKKQIARNEKLAKSLEVSQKDREEQTKNFHNNVR